MRVRTSLFAVSLFIAVIAVSSASASQVSETRQCAPPRGPGDTARHSANLRVENITCADGRKVALACVRFTYSHAGSCSAVGYRWRCTSTKPSGSASAQRCVSGQRPMRILWTD